MVVVVSIMFCFSNRWLGHVKDVLDTKDIETEQDLKVSWAAFHASEIESTGKETTMDISALLPLFQEQSPAMIKHSMNIVKKAVDFLNPGQVPVTACDQPLYAVAKVIQWNWPATHGEDRFVVMFGDFT